MKDTFHFDEAAANRAIEFFSVHLRHIEGELAGHPFELQPWQRQIVSDLFGWKRKNGSRRYRTSYLEVARKNGKALALDTLIPTPTGWTTMGEVQVGDVVFDEHGNQCRVTGATDIMHNRPCYLVQFSDGSSMVADENHQWFTLAKRTGRSKKGTLKVPAYSRGGQGRNYAYVRAAGRGKCLGRYGTEESLQRYQEFVALHLAENPIRQTGESGIRTTKEIAETLHRKDGAARVEWNHRIPVCGPLKTEDAALVVHPYVLGAWLGDGDSSSARFTCAHRDKETITNIRQCGVSAAMKNPGTTLTVGRYVLGKSKTRRESLNRKLRLMGLLNNKHIPREYLRASESQRMELLRGLMDTDGSVCITGKNQVPQCEFSTTKPALRDGVLELVRSLGFKPNTMVARASLNGKDCGEVYRIQFNAYSDRSPFRLKRKAARLRPRPQTGNLRSAARQIIGVESVASVPVRCIEVDSPSHLYLAGEGMIPTHNSTLAAGFALYLLLCDGEAKPQVYSAAGDRSQARIVFEAARDMVAANPILTEQVETYQHRLVGKHRHGFYSAISAEAYSKHGFNAHGIIFDELHVQADRELWDVLTTSVGARRQPLTIAITTAGYDRSTICWELHQRARAALADPDADPYFYPVIYAADEKDDWKSEETWRKANPNYGVSVAEDFMREKCDEAQRSPSFENTFKRLHLNLWTEQDIRWLPMDAWDSCEDEFNEETLRGEPCFAGLDLASTRDVNSLVLYFPESHSVLPFFWVPKEAHDDAAARDRRQVMNWASQGKIRTTEGNTTDYATVIRDIGVLATMYDIQKLAYDPWGPANAMVQTLQADGFDRLEEYRQGYSSLASPTKELERLVIGGKLKHNGDPVLRWMASNVTVKQDPAGNIKPDKSKSSDKIDGIVALIMALGLSMRYGDSGRSVYETSGSMLL